MPVTQTTPNGPCETCGKPATTYCAACVIFCANDQKISTIYCSKTCQINGWAAHKAVCKIFRSRKKLRRAAILIQDVFFTVRSQAFDLDISSLTQDEEGVIHIFDGRFEPVGPTDGRKGGVINSVSKKPFRIHLAGSWKSADSDATQEVLSYNSGGDLFSHALYEVGVNTIEGTVEELDIRVLDSKIKVHRHTSGSANSPLQRTHHVLLVTLTDGTVWIIDPAGGQHGQHEPLVPYAEYSRDYIAEVLACRPYGFHQRYPEKFIAARHPQYAMKSVVPLLLGPILEYAADEVAEWQFSNVSVKAIVEASEAEHNRLKDMLLSHVAGTTREMVKFVDEDKSSAAKPIPRCIDATPEHLPEEDKARIDRKRARLAQVQPNLAAMSDAGPLGKVFRF